MAIQFRRGSYDDFDPAKLVEGELAVVLSDDPNSSTGRALYVCFTPGVVKRIADYEDIEDLIDDATEDVQASFLSAITQAISAAGTATSAANTAASNATTAAGTANTAASAANDAAAAASAAAGGDVSSKTVTFETAESRSNVASGDSLATLFGKIKKWFSDIQDGAFKRTINSLSITAEGWVLDARQGKVLKDEIDAILEPGDKGSEILTADLNTFTTYGRYYSRNASRTNTLTNKPSGLPSAAFLLVVDTAGAWDRQVIYSGHNTYPYIFVRNFSGSTFSPWYKIGMTQA